MSKPLPLGDVYVSDIHLYTRWEERKEGRPRHTRHSEVRLLLCDGCNGPIALEFGFTVINHHCPWACPKLAPHFQIGARDHQLAEFLNG